MFCFRRFDSALFFASTCLTSGNFWLTLLLRPPNTGPLLLLWRLRRALLRFILFDTSAVLVCIPVISWWLILSRLAVYLLIVPSMPIKRPTSTSIYTSSGSVTLFVSSWPAMSAAPAPTCSVPSSLCSVRNRLYCTIEKPAFRIIRKPTKIGMLDNIFEKLI